MMVERNSIRKKRVLLHHEEKAHLLGSENVREILVVILAVISSFENSYLQVASYERQYKF